MKKMLTVLFAVTTVWFVYESFFAYKYVSKETRWGSNELLWEVAERCTGPHEDVREVLCRIESNNPGAKPGDVLKVKIKVRR